MEAGTIMAKYIFWCLYCTWAVNQNTKPAKKTGFAKNFWSLYCTWVLNKNTLFAKIFFGLYCMPVYTSYLSLRVKYELDM